MKGKLWSCIRRVSEGAKELGFLTLETVSNVLYSFRRTLTSNSYM